MIKLKYFVKHIILDLYNTIKEILRPKTLVWVFFLLLIVYYFQQKWLEFKIVLVLFVITYLLAKYIEMKWKEDYKKSKLKIS